MRRAKNAWFLMQRGLRGRDFEERNCGKLLEICREEGGTLFHLEWCLSLMRRVFGMKALELSISVGGIIFAKALA